MSTMRPWEGNQRCRGFTREKLPCGNWEILGLEFCLQHVPDDLLEEAEEITGLTRCRHESGCQQICATGSTICKNHGGQIGGYQRKVGAQRIANDKAEFALGAIMGENGNRLLNALPVENPLEDLLAVAGEIREFKDILREIIADIDPKSYRYRADKVGEQVRAELLLYERGLDRYATLLVQITRLNIEERLAAVREKMAQAIEHALTMSLEASGLDLDGQDKARKVLRRELKAVA
jgi:hypothetical protein